MASRTNKVHNTNNKTPSCLACARCDDGKFDCANWCGPKYRWGGYIRSELMDSKKQIK